MKKRDAVAGAAKNDGAPRLIARKPGLLLVAGLLLFLLAGATSTFADEPAGLPTSQQIAQAIEAEGSQSVTPQLTDPTAPEGVPHRELGRDEAVELLQDALDRICWPQGDLRRPRSPEISRPQRRGDRRLSHSASLEAEWVEAREMEKCNRLVTEACQSVLAELDGIDAKPPKSTSEGTR